MKKHFYTILLVFFWSSSFAQSNGETYIIKLKDKGNTEFSTSVPDKFLSPRSIERRIVQQVPIDQTDLPVNKEYIQAITATGAKVIYTSKWLNEAIIEVNESDQITKITSLPFIQSLKQSNVFKTKKNRLFRRFLEQEKFKDVNDGYKSTNSTNDFIFDYGISANQVKMINIDRLHVSGYTGQDIMIAVIDAGFRLVNQMSAFDTLRARGLILGTRDFVQPGNDVYGEALSNHGTMVLSTMGGNIPGQIVGTAPHAKYWLMRTEDASAEYRMEEYYWVAAAEYADSLGVDIINTSLGYTTFDDPTENHTYSELNGDTAPITRAADLAAKKGMLVVNSAGNSGNEPWRYISFPADGDSVLSVGAVDINGVPAAYSSVGPTSDGRIKPDVVTQGFQTVVAADGAGIIQANGTSFSAPLLSGAAACLWQANPTLTNMEIYNAIKKSGSIASNPNNTIGWGVPDFSKAMNLVLGNEEYELVSDNMICYPNPFTSFIKTSINISNPAGSFLRLINTHGKIVKEYSSFDLVQGINEISIDGLDILPKGIYFLQFSDGASTISQKLLK